MRLRSAPLFILTLILGFLSCKKDDDGDTVVEVELNDRTEQQVIDNDSIIGYLETHYYNSSMFDETNLDPSIDDLIITELLDGEAVPDGSTLLINDIITKTLVFADTDYEIHYLNINQGGGTSSPNFADNVDVLYEGFDLENEVFDSRVNLEEDPFDLLNLITGWRKILPEFNTAESFIENNDGTVNYINSGVGVMFVPSGLAYFSSAIPVSSYSPIAFKFELIKTTENDHDGDGVPSYLEDLNGDGEFTVADEDDETITHDDTDGDGLPDYFDTDDDGDGILTIYEDIDGDGDPTNDIGSNGIAKYLDAEETESNQ